MEASRNSFRSPLTCVGRSPTLASLRARLSPSPRCLTWCKERKSTPHTPPLLPALPPPRAAAPLPLPPTPAEGAGTQSLYLGMRGGEPSSSARPARGSGDGAGSGGGARSVRLMPAGADDGQTDAGPCPATNEEMEDGGACGLAPPSRWPPLRRFSSLPSPDEPASPSARGALDTLAGTVAAFADSGDEDDDGGVAPHRGGRAPGQGHGEAGGPAAARTGAGGGAAAAAAAAGTAAGTAAAPPAASPTASPTAGGGGCEGGPCAECGATRSVAGQWMRHKSDPNVKTCKVW